MNESKSVRNFIADHLEQVPRSGIRDFFEIVSNRDDVISLSIGEPDFLTPWHIREASVYALDHGATSYTDNRGLIGLRRETASYMERSFGISYDPASEILITVGVSEAVDLALRATLNPGDEVLYHEPSYVSYAPVVTFAHGHPIPVTTYQKNDFRLTRDMLEDKVTDRTKALILNYPTNPTGGVLEREDMEGIAAFACEHDLLVLSDEVYSELTYEGEKRTIAAMPGMRERTVILNGFSKAWAMTGYRIGFSCAPPVLTDAMMKIHQYTIMCAPILSQEAAKEALLKGDKDIVEMRESYLLRRNFICSALNDMGLTCHVPRASFYAFPCIEGFGMNSKEFSLKLLEDEKVACVPGTAFGRSGEGFMRCCFATGMDDLKEALDRMSRFVERLQK